MTLLEKAYAKVNRNYEGINYGWMADPMRVFTGAPSLEYKTSISLATQWKLLMTAT